MPISTNRKDNFHQRDTKGRPSNGLSLKIHLKVGGYTHWVHPHGSSFQAKIVLTSKAWDKVKDKAGPQPKRRSKNGNNFWWRPSSRLFSKIYSKLGGYTHWVHLRCTQWSSESYKLKCRPLRHKHETRLRSTSDQSRRRQQEVIFFKSPASWTWDLWADYL